MDSDLYEAVTQDNIDVLVERRLSVEEQRTANGSTVLHLACQHGSIKCVEHILSVHLPLLLKRNSRRETGLHLAARQGHYQMVVALLDAAKSSLLKPEYYFQDKSLTILQNFIRTPDLESETAMHMAVRYNQKNVIQLLLNEDPSYSYPLRNPKDKQGGTPLYLASIRGYSDIIRTILDNSESPEFGGPFGRTALHAALLDDGGHDCVKLLLEKNRGLVKIADSYGWTAFHYVAYNDLHTIVEDLIVADKSVGYQKDDRHGRTALHVAAYQGNVGVMKKLVEYYPDSWGIIDRDKKNILHIAVEQDQKEVIQFILSQGYKEMNNLLIQKDREGNTPLHLVAKLGCYVQEFMDLKEVLLDWEVLNKKGLTPLDVLDSVQTGTPAADQAMVRTTLIRAKAKRHYVRLQQDIEMPDVEMKEINSKYVETVEKAINTHIIVAALITTVALTAGFAMPGGFNSTEGENQGSPMLLKKAAFQAFIITDAIALLLSISSLFLYFWTTLLKYDSKTFESLFVTSSWLNLFSFLAMMLAFITGTYAVLVHSLALAISVCIISSLFFIFLFYVLYKVVFIRYLYFRCRTDEVAV